MKGEIENNTIIVGDCMLNNLSEDKEVEDLHNITNKSHLAYL